MRIVVVAVGKLKDAALRAVAADYIERAARYLRCDEIEVASASKLEAAIPADAFVVALEVGGLALSSKGFAGKLEAWGRRGKGVVVFVVGAADGIPRAVSDAADAKLSLSTLTLPHRLARVVLWEQIYRALTILRGEPYAREG
jgi:23S rRNA (pseudouridine1915-N3)-methyltransferase